MNDVMELSVDDGRDARPVFTMNKKRVARGFRSGPVTVTASATIAMAVVPEVDWFELQRTQEEFTIGYERGSGGLRFQLISVRVTSIRDKFGSDGEPTQEISFVSTEHREIG